MKTCSPVDNAYSVVTEKHKHAFKVETGLTARLGLADLGLDWETEDLCSVPDSAVS